MQIWRQFEVLFEDACKLVNAREMESPPCIPYRTATIHRPEFAGDARWSFVYAAHRPPLFTGFTGWPPPFTGRPMS